MLDEQEFVARLEAADTEEFAAMLRRPTADEHRVLRSYLGDDRYRRQRDLVLHQAITRGEARAPLGGVVVVHGIMGSELSSFTRAGAAEHIWVKVVQIIGGVLDRLRLGDDGLHEIDERFDVRPTGILKRHYGDLLLSLSARWRVRAFWFDWRKDLGLAAADLDAKIQQWFEPGRPVHIVAHSMGGLVARTFVVNYHERWDRLRGENGDGGRLVMLGTPNHGSFVIPQVVAGIETTVKRLALLDLRHSVRELQAIFNSFPGLFQMLPSPLVADGRWEKLYEAETYGLPSVRQAVLDKAKSHHNLLAEVVDPERLVYVAGANRPTFCGLRDLARMGDLAAYDVSSAGDGRVPHDLGLLDGVPTYYVDERHGDLAVNRQILRSLGDLLLTGRCDLPDRPPAVRAAVDEEELRARLVAEDEEQETRVREYLAALGARSTATGVVTQRSSGFREREVEDSVVREFLSAGEPVEAPAAPTPGETLTLELRVLHAYIQDAHEFDDAIDAIAVGHYVGVRPQEAELALDRAITAALRPPDSSESPGPRRLLLTDYSERGIIRGELAQPFFLADPRDASAEGSPRLIVIAGMGIPGRFGAPELTVLARELCWSLGKLGKRSLATILIGAGTGNLGVRQAVDASLRGARDALTGSHEDANMRIHRLTFVEASGHRVCEIDSAIVRVAEELAQLDDPLQIAYTPLSKSQIAELEAVERPPREEKEWEKEAESDAPRVDSGGGRSDPIPTRVTLSLDDDTFRFGAITADASLPERSIALDPKLVEQANDELAAEWRKSMQQERGELLERLLVPTDLRGPLAGAAPLVMLLDATTARIHWEMLAQPEVGAAGMADTAGDEGSGGPARDREPLFLGTRRGLTRQLRTTFAPPPEPPPPPRRVLRVLVVADPAEDAPLEGAEEEGVAVADLFEAFNDLAADETESRVRVERLFGPNDATRTQVLRHLICKSYDVLHYAGHCVYDEANPARQGWLFKKEGLELLSPNELNRIDRIPKFVVSNACQSGVTPDRAGDRAAGLAPSFAESFFARGVANFVCTAWPVNDVAARQFAVTLYSRLLGIEPLEGVDGGFRKTEPWSPEAMHDAMRAARLRILDTLDGVQTWGAYQHYGNPYFRLFEPKRA